VLRSGKVIDNHVGTSSEPKVRHSLDPNSRTPPTDDSDESNPEPSSGPSIKSLAPLDQPIGSKSDVPRAPFPQRLGSKKKHTAQMEKILDMFKQVKINIPLLDAIQQVPAYAKFLKDLCTMKRTTNVPKKAFLTANVSSILTQPIPLKRKDPGCPTISCIIGDTRIDRALLDLGASVNLLPYSVYEQLGLGELKPTRTTIQLADRSVKIPRGMLEDVLIKVGEFIFPVDFIVLETEPVRNPRNQIPVILGRPFLATSNAIINCRTGLMKLSFGNMTVELKLFNLSNQ